MLDGRVVESQRVLRGARTLDREQRGQCSLMRRKPRADPGRKRRQRDEAPPASHA